MKKVTLIALMFIATTSAWADNFPFGKGQLVVKYLANNAVRIQYDEGTSIPEQIPDWSYVRTDEVAKHDINVKVDNKHQLVQVKDKKGRVVFTATSHDMEGEQATMSFKTPKGEYLYGLGQFQDGYSNVRGLSRRLTQVNTQISLPMVMSNKGYAVLWNNCGMTEFNPCANSINLVKSKGEGKVEEVEVTSTVGGKKEKREHFIFKGSFSVAQEGDYAILLDVGQKMARRHDLSIDGKKLMDQQNIWLPPTSSVIVHLKKGSHQVSAELTKGDKPVLYYNKVGDLTTFRSPIASKVDYTVFVGSADEIIASYRDLTGAAPQIPSWALGYIHCRERFHSSDEILQTANRFKKERIPIDMIVQDWQYWGKYGWNAMKFDEDNYPDVKALTDYLHHMGIKMMLSVWAKIDKRSELGKQVNANGYYVPGTEWIDFFNPKAAGFYWKNFSERLVPLGIDAWWQDATEPENDDLAGRMVNAGKWRGNAVRNAFPLMVNKTVYEGLKACGKDSIFILTRCGFPGIQRYGAALWSGDVGNDWETFRRQITAGLGVQAAGVPWWTYDAGGFFRPKDQYTNQAYIDRMLRWVETSVYLPLMRIHGYISNTEPWNYGKEAQEIITKCIKEREALRPYIEECARRVSSKGYTLMRPLVFDFPADKQALDQKYEYMFGPKFLISPVTEPDVTEWKTYLPKTSGRWRDRRTGEYYKGGQTVTTKVDKTFIPVFELEK